MSAKKVKIKPDARKSRKQLRKEERKNKKIRRNEYYTNRRKPGQFVLAKKTNVDEDIDKEPPKKTNKSDKRETTKESNKPLQLKVEDQHEKEKKQQKKLQQQMRKQRHKKLIEANEAEDRNIKQLEKKLKLNKRKSKSMPASFSKDGLDYLLEVCDPENLKHSALAEQHLTEVNDEFEEDLVLMTGKSKSKEDEDGFTSDDETGPKRPNKRNEKNEPKGKKLKTNLSDEEFEDDAESDDNDNVESGDDHDDDDDDVDMDDDDVDMSDDDVDMSDADVDYPDGSEEDFNDEEENIEDKESNADTWEDIYGRLRSKDGTIVTDQSQKYVPPAARAKSDTPVDKVRAQKLDRLKKQLKGFINRLAESNMHSIATQIEELYMNNSRNDMNSTITNLIIEALVSSILAPERLLMEHILLVVILHANVGTEVGAHFLQSVIKLFDADLRNSNVENKKLDNVVIILAQLYNFKLFDSKLIYEIIDKLSEKFEEKNVECILHILRNVGFNLRKDNAIALKNLILSLQKKAGGASDELKDNSRVKFMLDVLLAIKNNNVTKIPNYDTSYSEHLKKILKGFIRKGNYVTQLNISLEDLLKADEKGKWWVVGSAWTRNTPENSEIKSVSQQSNSFSQKLLELASKQRMNTDTRKNIFCIIMSAEDYLDAFEKLLKLSLKNQQEREIIHVILHCCLQEKKYNPYYATLAQKFCEHDRKYQMTIKYSIWDKLKALKDHSANQISHLAKLLSHLFIEKGLPISTLKVVQFSELDKITLRFIRQILLGILSHEDLEVCKNVFEKVGQSDKLKMFRESLRLFLHHFLLRNLESQGVDDDKKVLLQQRIKVVEKLLAGRELKIY